MTVLEAHVEQGHTDTLKQAYHEEVDRHMLPSIYQTFLVHALNDPSLWRIITVWRSREDLQAMRQLTRGFEPPPGASNTRRALLYGLAELQRDSRRHIDIENQLLFPRALARQAQDL